MKRNEKMCSTDKFNIAVITFPFYTEVPKIFIANLLDLLEPSSNRIYVITGFFSYKAKSNTKIHIISIKKDDIRGSLLKRILRYLLAQPRVTFNLLKISKKIDVVIFFLGTRTYLLPLLVAKLLNKKVALTVTGSESKGAKMQYGKKLFGLGRVYSIVVGMLERINYHLADQIAVESKSTVDFQGLNKFRNKIAINGAMYIDTNLFTVKKELKSKRSLIGYIGRISLAKGVLNFIDAIPLVLREREDIEFLIGGDGPLFDEIKREFGNKGLHDKVKLTGWIPHEELPTYFSGVKLMVLPSENEGVPGIVQEAMACGTPVLATSVGAIPDLIQDGKTGFIMGDNSPERIAENVIRALEQPNIDEIAKNARKLIEDEYSYDVMVKKCRDSLDELMRGKR